MRTPTFVSWEKPRTSSLISSRRWSRNATDGDFEAEKFQADVTKSPIPRFDLLKFERVPARWRPVLPRLPVQLRVLRHHRALRPGAARKDRRPDARRARRALSTRLSRPGRLRRRQHDRQQESAQDSFCRSSHEWQEQHNYPFEFTTEASINLADDEELLHLLREPSSSPIFVGIESPTRIPWSRLQKKQNTRRDLAESVHRIYSAGMFVTAGFIVGFDSEKEGSLGRSR